MLTYTSGRNLLGTLTNNENSSTNLLVLDTLRNEAIRELTTVNNWNFLQSSYTASTVASQQFYTLKADVAKVLNVTVTVGNNTYSPIRVRTREQWDNLNGSSHLSNTPLYYFVFGRTLGFYPTPQSATTNGITVRYQKRHRDLVAADYTTGTITTATNASVSITGSGTTWTSQMVGRKIRITHSDTANTGDGIWYEIATVPSATTMTLVEPYSGTSISGGSAAYTIGDVGIIPEEFQMIPIYRALENYFTYIQPEEGRADRAKIQYAQELQRMKNEAGSLGVT